MKTKMLVIEDSELMQAHIARAIRKGFPEANIHKARTVPEVRSLLKANRYHVVISDLYYHEDRAGRAYDSVLEIFDASPHYVPVIFVAREAEPRHIFDVAKRGGYDFFVANRNFTPSELIASINSAIEFGRIPQVFISYASADQAFAERLASSVRGCGFQVWFDQWEIRVGDSIIRRIEEGILTSSHLIVVLSSASVSSRWVREELYSAMTSQIKDREIRILPVLVEECEVPPFLRTKKYADFREDYSLGLRQVVNGIQLDHGSQLGNT